MEMKSRDIIQFGVNVNVERRGEWRGQTKGMTGKGEEIEGGDKK